MFIEIKAYQTGPYRWNYLFRDRDGKLHGDVGFPTKESALAAGRAAAGIKP